MIRIPIVLLASLFFSLTSCNQSSNVPNVVCEIHSTLPGLPGDKIDYTFSLNSSEPLISFIVEPEITEGNTVAGESFLFPKGALTGNINYSFVVPKNIKDISFIKLKLTITDSKGINTIIQTLPVYNPPQFAVGLAIPENDN